MGAEMKVVVFRLGEEEYGLDITQVSTIERMMPITRVPKTHEFIKGVVNLRGAVVPLIDLRGRFGIPEIEYTDTTRTIIVNVNEMEVGFIVDSATDVVDLNTDQINTPPDVVGGIQAKYLQGVAKLDENRLLVMLNLEEVLNKQEIVLLEEVTYES